MLADLAARYPVVQQTFEEASDILGYDLWKLSQTGPEEILNQTDKTQPALLAAGVAGWRIWQQQGGPLPAMMAGHSFGEYTALVCAGALEFKDTVSLAEARGRFMQTAVPPGQGAMAAILGLEDTKIQEICTEVAQGQIVAAVNFNAPTQTVVAGHTTAVERVITQAKTAGAKKTMLLAVSVPAHCALMQPAADQMAQRLALVPFRPPTIPVIHNVDVSTKTNPDEIRNALVAQLCQPVRWVETIQAMAAAGVTKLFECGPGKVLIGLNKRIARQMTVFHLEDLHSFEQALQIFKKETVVCNSI
jgi:[acyl-carrier-protein] S-malonyltransferase